MSESSEDTKHGSSPGSGRWVWSHESHTLEFVSCSPAEEAVLKKTTQTNVELHDVQRRAEWLADMSTLNHRGRRSIRKRVCPAHLTEYMSSVMKRREDRVTIDDVKRKCKELLNSNEVAVSLLQENYSLPVPFCFLSLLKSKELDDVLAALLLYLSCFFEHTSLQRKSQPFIVGDVVTERQKMAEISAKQEIAKKKLAVRYFSLFMDLVVKQHKQAAFDRGSMSSSEEWLLEACLYSFLCFVAWVTFGRKNLREIQEEIGRLLYSDTFNMAVRKTTDGDSTGPNSSPKMGDAEPKKAGRDSQTKPRMSRRGPAQSSVVNQRSPLMVSLFPSPKERSPHLFLGSRARRQSPLQAEHCDTEALTEQLNQQLASVSFGILGQSLKQFNSSTLIPNGEEKNSRGGAGSDVDNSEDHPGNQGQGSRSTYVGLGSTGFFTNSSVTHINTRTSEATAVTSRS